MRKLLMSKERDNVFKDINLERDRQDNKWGVQKHDPFTWMTVLGEEYGEACQASLQAHFGINKSLDNYREELIQVAAVAVAAIECLDKLRT